MWSLEKYNRDFVKLIILTFLVMVIQFGVSAQELNKVKDLSGRWKFSIGDNPEWASPDYDDSNWESMIKVEMDHIKSLAKIYSKSDKRVK